MSLLFPRARRRRASARLSSYELYEARLPLTIAQPGIELGDFNDNQRLDVGDVDALMARVALGAADERFDVNQDGAVNSVDHQLWVEVLRRTYVGDANLDGRFDSRDLVAVFREGAYERNPHTDASWALGDWNGDGVFSSQDLTAAFLEGSYEQGLRPLPAATLWVSHLDRPTRDTTSGQVMVRLTGSAEPLTVVQLPALGIATDTDWEGKFTFDQVRLPEGRSWLDVVVTDINGLRVSQRTQVTVNVTPTVWQERAPLNAARGEMANAVVNGKIYVFGGIDSPFDGPDTVEVYDPTRDTWSAISSMPVPRHHITAGASVYGEEVWLVGGKTAEDSTGVNRVDIYNTRTNAWRRGPDLPEVHWGGPTVIVGDELHVLTGGQGRETTTAHHFVLDLNNEAAGWRSEAPVPLPRVHAAGVALDGLIYVMGGELHHSHDQDTATVQVYDPRTNQWDVGRAPLPEARSHLEWSTFVYEGAIVSVAGVDSSRQPRGQKNVYRFDQSLDKWTLLTELPFSAVSPGAKIIDGTLYVFGGGVNNWFGGTMTSTYALELA